MLDGPGNPGSLAIHGFSALPLLMCWEEQARNLKARDWIGVVIPADLTRSWVLQTALSISLKDVNASRL